jgi:hypothetical protein
MDKDDKAIFEAHAIMQAHANYLLRLVQAPFSVDYVKDIRAQVDRLDAAHRAFIAVAPLPTEVQEAA